ncbi:MULTISPECIES: hypothetical protein [unclassified Myroides]|uniref:hypothetical protein n=1 Tax=unclassified Myroides TaxID=2642485 RepID=UPI0015FCE247|nr:MULTISPECIES: hypothetical protein [unclassified Myroides]MBB1150163.1 hypothetical protein [Myroides sp. NP-2]MDM1408396.1 hypothetical protein [Myroides sp. DF42-4-2]
MLSQLVPLTTLNPNLASLQAITLMLHLCFLIAFLIIIIRFTRDFFFYKHPFQLAFNRRKAPLIVLAIVYSATMFAIYFMW